MFYLSAQDDSGLYDLDFMIDQPGSPHNLTTLHAIVPMARRSIWTDIDQENFYETLQDRCNHTRWKTDHIISASWEARQLQDDRLYRFDFDVESELADYFAFFAAWKSDPSYVAAATVSPDASLGGLVIALAANEGIADDVQKAMQKVLDILQRCASDASRSRRESAAQCLEAVLALHERRIKDRLSFKSKQGIVKVATRLTEDVNKLEVNGSWSQPDTIGLRRQIDQLVGLMREAEGERRKERLLDILTSMTETAYDMSTRGTTFTQLLRTAGIQQGDVQPKEARVVDVLAKYWRSCLRLCECARCYRGVFQRLRLTIARVDWRERRPAYRLFVHAEIQLLLLHESAPSPVKPRVIVASKRACFLCAAFISSYGTYVVQSSHGEIFQQWTVPDRREYDRALRERIGRTLERVLGLVRSAKQLFEPPAPQSVINLVLSIFRQCSMETIRSRLSPQASERLAEHRTSASSRLGAGHGQGSTVSTVERLPISERAGHAVAGPSTRPLMSLSEEPTQSSELMQETRHAVEICTDGLGAEADRQEPVEGLPENSPYAEDASSTASENGSGMTKDEYNQAYAERHDSLGADIKYADRIDEAQTQENAIGCCKIYYGTETPWIKLLPSMQMEPHVVHSDEPASRGRYLSATCHVRPCFGGESLDNVMNFEDIDDKDGVRLERPGTAESLGFVLRRTGYEDLMLRIQWSDWGA